MKSLPTRLKEVCEFDHMQGTHSNEVRLKPVLDALVNCVKALEFECGNKCNAEYNPCNAREALAKLESVLKEGK